MTVPQEITVPQQREGRTAVPGHTAVPGDTAVPAQRTQRGTDQEAAGARWRALLEARWRDRLHELTELCVAFHESGPVAPASPPRPSLRRLMRRAVAARQALAETDAALRRVARGAFGRCEDCSAEIPASSLLSAPETRYCQGCAAY
jgi:RNA polymerase-binding transcription factor DksA